MCHVMKGKMNPYYGRPMAGHYIFVLWFLLSFFLSVFLMVALCNRADHHIFILFLSSSSSFFFLFFLA